MAYQTSTQPIPISPTSRSRMRSPSPARSTYSRFSRDGSDSGRSQEWHSPFHRPASSASRSSGGHSSDLIFSMDSERSSSSSSSRHGSAEPGFLYDDPCGYYVPDEPPAMLVCLRCRRQFYGNTPPRGAYDRTRRDEPLVCPSCTQRESWQPAPRPAPDDDFYESAGYHPQRSTHGRRSQSYRSSQTQQPPTDTRSGRQRMQSMSPIPLRVCPQAKCSRRADPPTYTPMPTHFLGRAFPAYRDRAPAASQQPFPPSAWADHALPPATPVQRAAPASHISRPRTPDPFGASTSSRHVHHRRQ
ncbi:hypothetical protein C8Q80DRAFT_745451 [Daedaleopsis nitida]|nr:hypothetical protein C8Q80DRAFT_745451 [Daedaleopsis nitida]